MIEVIAIFDIGKTNKKLLLFDRDYQVVHQHMEKMEETVDEDGFQCEDLHALLSSVRNMLRIVCTDERYVVKALNFSAYGASFVHVDHDGNPLTPLYNYLKPFPPLMQEEFFQKYGGEQQVSRLTASPVLGSLNSGLQVYRIKKERPELFGKIAHALHLPQFLAYLFSGRPVSEITSIGCHTMLWDFTQDLYHEWVLQEGMAKVFPPIVPATSAVGKILEGHEVLVGTGLHDSSAALVPYLMQFSSPFLLISTGTWSISLNPFNQEPLTDDELKQDCLCYLQYNGKPVKASRLFLGKQHEEGAERIAKHYALPADFFVGVKYRQDLDAMNQWKQKEVACFEDIELTEVGSPDVAYHMLVASLVELQVKSTNLISGKVIPPQLLVDGGFSHNDIFMHLLALEFQECRVYASEVAQASALGAALVLHETWNPSKKLNTLIRLVEFKP